MRRLESDELSTVVVGHDFSPHGEDALWFACNIARGNPNAILHVVHVVLPPVGVVGVLGAPVATNYPMGEAVESARAELERICANMSGMKQGRVVTHIRAGDPAHEVVALATELHAELIVVGTHGRTGLGRVLFGSLAQTISKQARCSVLIAHGAMPRDSSG